MAENRDKFSSPIWVPMSYWIYADIAVRRLYHLDVCFDAFSMHSRELKVANFRVLPFEGKQKDTSKCL